MNYNYYYKLDENFKAVPIPSLEIEAIIGGDRRVDRTFTSETIEVSTVFLGINHGLAGRLRLFETMIFRDGHGSECWRTETFAEAKQCHWFIVNCLKERISPYWE